MIRRLFCVLKNLPVLLSLSLLTVNSYWSFSLLFYHQFLSLHFPSCFCPNHRLALSSSIFAAVGPRKLSQSPPPTHPPSHQPTHTPTHAPNPPTHTQVSDSCPLSPTYDSLCMYLRQSNILKIEPMICTIKMICNAQLHIQANRWVFEN